MVWTRVRGGVRGRERLTPIVDFLGVLLVLVALLVGVVWLAVLAAREGEGLAAFLAVGVALGLLSGIGLYVRAPGRQAVVLRPDTIELPVGRGEVTRVVVRWGDVARVRAVAGERAPVLTVELHDGARARRADGEDLLSGLPSSPAPEPDAVHVADAEAVALVLRHLLDHPEDRARLAARGGIGVVLAFSRPVYGIPPEGARG